MKYYFDTTGLVKIHHREIGSDQVVGIYKGTDIDVQIINYKNILSKSSILKGLRQ